MHFDPHFEKVRGGIEPWWMAHWKARAEFLLSVIELFFYLLQLRRYEAKCVKTRCLHQWVGYLEPKYLGEGVVPGEYFLFSTKLDTFCIVLRAVVSTQYRRVTDRQTDRRTELL